MKKIMMIAAMAAMALNVSAQDNVEATVSADVVSNYIWRGAKLDDAAIQPSVGVSYKGLSLSGWGSYGLTTSGMTKEFDLTLGYSAGNFNVGITDYFCVGSDAPKYFLYDSHNTAHVFEANVGYDFGPLSLQWFTNFAGADVRTDKDKRAYTSYFELSAPFKLGGLDWDATLGGVPYGAKYGFYEANASGFAITNISVKASKDIKITDSFTLPLFAQVATNPSTQKAYLVLGFTLQP